MDIFTHEQSFCSVRSPQWLRGKWWSLKRHVPDYQLLPFPGTALRHCSRARQSSCFVTSLRASFLAELACLRKI